MRKKKKKLQGLAEWGSLHLSLSIHKCPKCDNLLTDLSPLGFWLGVCKHCKKFWSVKIVDVTKELSSKFKKENL